MYIHIMITMIVMIVCVCVFEHDHKIERRKPFGATMLCGSMCWAVDQTRVRNVLTS